LKRSVEKYVLYLFTFRSLLFMGISAMVLNTYGEM